MKHTIQKGKGKFLFEISVNKTCYLNKGVYEMHSTGKYFR